MFSHNQMVMTKAWNDVSHRLAAMVHAKLIVFGALTHIDSGLSLNAQAI